MVRHAESAEADEVVCKRVMKKMMKGRERVSIWLIKVYGIELSLRRKGNEGLYGEVGVLFG